MAHEREDPLLQITKLASTLSPRRDELNCHSQPELELELLSQSSVTANGYLTKKIKLRQVAGVVDLLDLVGDLLLGGILIP